MPIPYERIAGLLRADRPVAVATVVEGPGLGRSLLVTRDDTEGGLGNDELDRVVTRDLQAELETTAHSGLRHYGECGEARQDAVTVFFDVHASSPQMIVFGAVDFTRALTEVAGLLGYRVTVADARPVFATEARFPAADEVVVAWPDKVMDERAASLGPNDAVCVLTHDHKFDVPALVGALSSRAGYIGAMGSRRTHRERLDRLREAGVDEDALARIHSPIGLDLGARTPEETAVSICAEIIANRTGRLARGTGPLSDADGPIH